MPTSASGPFPDVGRVAGSATVGTVMFSLAQGAIRWRSAPAGFSA